MHNAGDVGNVYSSAGISIHKPNQFHRIY